MSYYLDPIQHITGFNFSVTAKGRTNGGTAAVRPDGSETEQAHSATTVSGGFAVIREHYFWVKQTAGTGFIEYYNVLEDTYAEWGFGSSEMYIANDCATDGEFLYVVGVDSAGNNNVIEKWTIEGVYVTRFLNSDCDGTAPSIAANPEGFVVSRTTTIGGDSTPSALFFEPDGTFVTKVAFTATMVVLEHNLAATRDRFFISYLEDGPTIDPMKVGVYDSTGTSQYTIDFGTQNPEYGYWPYIAVSETHFFFFVDVDYDGTNSVLVVYERDVTRDDNGDITSDAINASSRAQYTMTAADYWYKATVDAQTFITY